MRRRTDVKLRFLSILLVLVGLVCLTQQPRAQIGTLGCGPAVGQPLLFQPCASPSAGCSQSATFLARTSGLDATHTTAYQTLICGLVTDGVWNSLDALYIFATQDSTTAGLNLPSTSFPITVHATVTFTVDRGYVSNGTTGFLSTAFIPSTAGGNFTQNSASFGFYNRTNTTDTSAIQMGVTDGTAISATSDSIVASTSQTRINEGGGDFVNLAGADVSGMYVTNRTASNAYKFYRYGNSVGTATDAGVSTGNPTKEFFILCENGNGTATAFSVHQIAAAFIGGVLNDTTAGNLQSRINAFMTTVGANVY